MDNPHREAGILHQNSPGDTVVVNDCSGLAGASSLGLCSQNSAELAPEPTTSSTAEESDEHPVQQARPARLSDLVACHHHAPPPSSDYPGDGPDQRSSESPARKKLKLSPEAADVEVATPVLPAIPPSLFEQGPSTGAAGRSSTYHESTGQNATHTSCTASASLQRELEPPASSDRTGSHSSTHLLPCDTTLGETPPPTENSVFEPSQVTATAPPQPVVSLISNTVMSSSGPRMDSHQSAGSTDPCKEHEIVAVAGPSAAGRSTLQPHSDILDLDRAEELRQDESGESSSPSSLEAAQDLLPHLPSPAYAVHQSPMHEPAVSPPSPAWSPPTSPPPFQPFQPPDLQYFPPPEFPPLPPPQLAALPALQLPPLPPPDFFLNVQIAPPFNDWMAMAMLEAEEAGAFDLPINIDETWEEPVPPGLSQGQIERLVTYQLTQEANESSAEPCVMCANHYQAEELVRVLPCGHEFHSPCIDTWLQINRACPFCRCDASTGTADAGEDS
ncbi:hypothetical protein HPB48_015196 [Haemaphysalis longicornis]|uniref:RING-type E3 ubiquitin transferase n=1 Tax=Haemaphysalis longicornis TaxID=44386 RepID=A0A9J6FKC0_HAELO|nr:hypothetical protein HPB48_015196 [Haemaphysalis longicornis]